MGVQQHTHELYKNYKCGNIDVGMLHYHAQTTEPILMKFSRTVDDDVEYHFSYHTETLYPFLG